MVEPIIILYTLFVDDNITFLFYVPVFYLLFFLQICTVFHKNISVSGITFAYVHRLGTVSFRTLELCLSEVLKCHLFVGVLGDRYGWIPAKHDVPSAPEFDWVREYPPGASITELEFHLAALAKPAEALENAFFYFRNSQFLRCDFVALP